MTGKSIIHVLESNGWIIIRQTGSHVRMGKGDSRTTVPVHGKKDVKKGTLANIERQTGVKLK
jgi:predicted RNA binding protein YcfA (HicA-like mRNA interferase family)